MPIFDLASIKQKIEKKAAEQEPAGGDAKVLFRVKKSMAAKKEEVEQQIESTSLVDERYQADAAGYIKDYLGWEPWNGTEREPGQMQIINAYNLAIAQQLEKHKFELGEIEADELKHWKPGQVIQNWIRVESGNLIGKTKLGSGLVNHFYDAFPSIIYTFAPSWHQIQNLLWKEIRVDRRTSGRPGRVLEGEPALKTPGQGDHMAAGLATNDAGGTGIERVQGQHHPYLMFVLDEAEGVADVIFEALEGMDTGLVVIILMLANPRTRMSNFHKIRTLPYVANFRISSLSHPNVRTGQQLILGAATRDWVLRRLENEDYCDEVDEHDEDAHTFEVDWIPNKIFRPKPLAFWRILGIAPENLSDDTFCPLGRYEAAKDRDPYDGDDPTKARLGVDVARYGADDGTLYLRHAGRLRRLAVFSQRRQTVYARRIKTAIQRLVREGVKDIELRIDAGGGYAGGVVDILFEDGDIRRGIDLTTGDTGESEKDHPFYGLEDFRVIEVHFNGTPHDEESFFDRATEMYYHLGEALKAIRLEKPPENLESDLCDRQFQWKKKKGIDVKRLVDKEQFKKKHQRSPDDGDGAALANAPDHVFRRKWRKQQFLSV